MSKPCNIDILVKGQNGGWTKDQLPIQDFIAQYDSHEAFIAFLPSPDVLVDLQLSKALETALQIPHSFFKSISVLASGFFGNRGISSDAKTSSLFYRFLIKDTIVKKYPKFQNIQAKNIYTWHKVCFFTSWTKEGKIRILCFDLPALLQEDITHSVREVSELSKESLGALALNNILVEETVSLFEKCLWNWRDVVRDLEQNRPGDTDDEPPDPDYIKLHEISRHIIHSSETITVAIETLNSMLKCYSHILHSSSAVEIDTQAELQQQASLLKCLQLRSQAVEARLRNEINLAFNLVAQYDSRSAVQISTNTATDSAAMKTISVLGLVFLPGTFICAIFSTTFFNFTPAFQSPDGHPHWTMSSSFWVYWAVAIPVTLITIVCWFVWIWILSVRSKTVTPMVRTGTFNSRVMKV